VQTVVFSTDVQPEVVDTVTKHPGNPQLQNPQVTATARAGRPVGTTNRWGRNSVAKLKELGFDPLEKMVELYDEITEEIKMMTKNPDGSRKYKVLKDGTVTNQPDWSALAHSTLIAAKNKVVSDLLRYGYARVTEATIVAQKEIKPLTIITSRSGDKFAPNEEIKALHAQRETLTFNSDGVEDVEDD
jgi:hypothetical protein